VTSRLAERLKAETRPLHVRAERSTFMSALLRGRMDRAAYAALLHNLQAIYAALEPALRRHAAHPALAPLDLAALARTQALRDDLAVLGLEATALRPASSRYAQRVNELDATHPELLLAHAYVRYLGDLSGGQLLQGIVAESLQLSPGTGTAFYDFGGEQAAARLNRAFRAALDNVTVDEDAVVEEAMLAFEWHRLLFDELAAEFGLSS
jgi:heme oxygenase